MKHSSLDIKKGLNDQTKVNPKMFTAGINEDDAVRDMKIAAPAISADGQQFMSPEEMQAEDAAAREDLIGEDQKKKRSKLSKMFRPKMSDDEIDQRVADRKTKKAERVTKRQKRFADNQPRLQAMGKILTPESSGQSNEGTSGTRYSPEGSAADRAFDRIIDTLTMRRSSGG